MFEKKTYKPSSLVNWKYLQIHIGTCIVFAAIQCKLHNVSGYALTHAKHHYKLDCHLRGTSTSAHTLRLSDQMCHQQLPCSIHRSTSLQLLATQSDEVYKWKHLRCSDWSFQLFQITQQWSSGKKTKHLDLILFIRTFSRFPISKNKFDVGSSSKMIFPGGFP